MSSSSVCAASTVSAEAVMPTSFAAMSRAAQVAFSVRHKQHLLSSCDSQPLSCSRYVYLSAQTEITQQTIFCAQLYSTLCLAARTDGIDVWSAPADSPASTLAKPMSCTCAICVQQQGAQPAEAVTVEACKALWVLSSCLQQC